MPVTGIVWSCGKYYLPHDTAATGGASNNTAARNDVLEDIKARLGDCDNLNTTIYVCDMDKGIISARIENDLELPMGIENASKLYKNNNLQIGGWMIEKNK